MLKNKSPAIRKKQGGSYFGKCSQSAEFLSLIWTVPQLCVVPCHFTKELEFNLQNCSTGEYIHRLLCIFVSSKKKKKSIQHLVWTLTSIDTHKHREGRLLPDNSLLLFCLITTVTLPHLSSEVAMLRCSRWLLRDQREGDNVECQFSSIWERTQQT